MSLRKKRNRKLAGPLLVRSRIPGKSGAFYGRRWWKAMEWLPRVGRERREENSGGRGSRELEMSERRAKSADGTDFERALFFSLSLSFVTFASF
jgi:hypothetical protein